MSDRELPTLQDVIADALSLAEHKFGLAEMNDWWQTEMRRRADAVIVAVIKSYAGRALQIIEKREQP